LAPEPIWRIRHLLTVIQGAIDLAPSTFASNAARQHLEDSLLIEIVDMLPTARACDDVRGRAARKRIVDRACDLMLSRLDDPPSILEVCRSVGASRRKLNYCFQEVLGASPISYLRAVRLNKVRRVLKQCEDDRSGVYDIAVRYGFWHFSQFSLDYKRHFAELPSETLRRARRRTKQGNSGNNTF
jgi:AraC family ethanolamine operon transcriptional activator